MRTSSLARRAAAALTGGALVASGLLAAGPAPQAHAAAVNPQATAAAAWLADQLDADGLFTYLDYKGDPTTDIGTTLDFGLSLAETDADAAVLDQLRADLDAALPAYVGATLDPSKAGPVAKAAFFYDTIGADLTDVAGIDLLQRLEDSVDDTTGQLGAFDDTYGQAWAVSVLKGADSPETAAATHELIGQQCPSAGWGFTYNGVCTSSADATAYTVLALLPQKAEPAVAAALDDAVTWLKGQQRADGGFGDWGVNTTGTTSEANGTGLVAWALGDAGETQRAQAAASWVADHQIIDVPGCGGPVPGEVGALAYDDQNIKDAIEFGIADSDQQTWVIAGAQALAGLQYLPARPAAKATLTGPTGYVAAGTRVTLKVSGLRSGQTACVTGIGATRWTVGSGSVTVTTPAVTRTNVATVRAAGGSASVTIKALGAATLKVKTPARVKARTKLTVTVTGLAPRERATIKVGTKKVVRTATAAGKVKVKVKVGRKKAKTKVVAVGQFANRKGKATVRVV